MTELLLIRHAESIWNAAGRWQGHGNPPLSERGREQAATLARELRGERVDALVASDLLRAFETASILGRALGVAPHGDARFRELDVGSWTGLSRSEIAERAARELERFDAGDPDVRPGGGETRREIRIRARGAAAELGNAYPGARVAIVTHLGVIRALVPGAEIDCARWRRLMLDELPPVPD